MTTLLAQEPQVPRHLYVQLVLAAEASLVRYVPFRTRRANSEACSLPPSRVTAMPKAVNTE